MKTEFINGFQRNYLKVALTETGGEGFVISTGSSRQEDWRDFCP